MAGRFGRLRPVLVPVAVALAAAFAVPPVATDARHNAAVQALQFVIFAAVIPAELRSRVSGAFQAVNYGTRPVGALLGGLLGTLIGLRAALWIASAGGVIGFLLLLPSPLPAYRMPSAVSAELAIAEQGG